MKAQINLLIIIFLLFGTMNSCTKFGKNVTIEGRVENPITGEGISGAEIWLLKTTMGLPGADKEIKTAISDANGNFELNKFSFRADKIRMGDAHGDYYTIGWHKDGEYVSTNSTLEIKKGKKLYVDFHMVPYGELQIKIKNTSCFNQNDELRIFRTSSILGYYDNVPNPAVYMGCYDFVGNLNKVPMGWYKYKGTVTKNGNEIPISDSIYLNKNETKILNIEYFFSCNMKAQRKLLIIIFLLLGTMNSCTKFGKNVTIKGRVMNPITGEGIAGATISASKITMELPGGYKTVEQTTSDTNGDFLLKFKKSASSIGVSTGNYHNIGWYQNGEIQNGYYLPVQQGKNMHADFYAVPYGELKLDINNVNCQGVTDTMWFRNKWLGYTGFESSYSTPRTGCYSYTSASPFKIPIGTYIYETKVKRSGNITFVYDTVTVNETGVSTISIDY